MIIRPDYTLDIYHNLGVNILYIIIEVIQTLLHILHDFVFSTLFRVSHIHDVCICMHT